VKDRVAHQENEEARTRKAGFSHFVMFFCGEAIRQPQSPAAHLYWASGETRCIGSSLLLISYLYFNTVLQIHNATIGGSGCE
jgi:hypothetical protein